jgi:hypothetical protein
MKKFFYLLVILGTVVMFQSCFTPFLATSPKKLHIQQATALTVSELNPGVRITPFLCDYEMIPKNNPSAVYEEFNTGLVFETSDNINAWINMYQTVVLSRMMKKYGADAILSVTSEAITNEKSELVITVRGYPVKYTNFRIATEKDIWMQKFELFAPNTISEEETQTGRINLKP